MSSDLELHFESNQPIELILNLEIQIKMFRPTATEFLERLELASKVKRKRKLTDSKEEKKPSKKDCDFKFYSKESFKLRFAIQYTYK